MASKRVFFFATRADIEPGIRTIEATIQLNYYLAGLRYSAEGDHFASLLELKTLGLSPSANQSLCDRYLTLRKDIEVKVRRIPQAKGGVRFSFDQRENPTSIVVMPGGVISPGLLMVGLISTASDDPASLKLLRKYGKLLTRGFVREDLYLIGKEALAMHREGARLIANHVAQNPEYDVIVRR